LELLGDGLSWEEAQERARSEGVLEADPAFDLEGWDAAAKLVILVSAVMEYPAKLEDVQLAGITGLNGETVREARQKGIVFKLVATATRSTDGKVSMQVQPTPLPGDHFLAQLGRKQMGVIYHTDIYGTLMTAIDEPDPLPSAATMLRDVLDIFAPAEGGKGR
jgi:homoserine dehydrogenase